MSRETKQTYIVVVISWVMIIALLIGMGHKAEKSFLSDFDALTERVDALEQKVAEIENDAPIDISDVSCIMPIGEYRCSHYCACRVCCGKDNGITASGTKATAGKTIAMEGVPIGTTVYIEALGEFRVVEDRFGNPAKTDCIDIFVDSHEEAINKGVYTSQVYIVVKGD